MLRFKEFNELCDQLAELADGMQRDRDPRSGSLPFCIQAFQTPRDDLRYITTYIAAGNEVCVCGILSFTAGSDTHGSSMRCPHASEGEARRRMSTDALEL